MSAVLAMETQDKNMLKIFSSLGVTMLKIYYEGQREEAFRISAAL